MWTEACTLARESWNKTNGEKALFWRAYGFVWLIASLAIFAPFLMLVLYFRFYDYFQHVLSAPVTFFVLFASGVLMVVGIFYSIFLFAALPYLCLRYLQGEVITSSLAFRKVLVRKGALFLNWFFFMVIYSLLHTLLHTIWAGQCYLLCVFAFIVFNIVWAFSLLYILDKNEDAFMAFAVSWKMFFKQPLFCLLIAVWVLVLMLFGFFTLFIGSIWAAPAQYNATVLLYQKMQALLGE